MSKAGHNSPPVEITTEEAAFIAAVLERDLNQSLQILTLVQEGKMSMESAEAAIAYSETAKPILRKLKEQLK